MGGAFSRSSGRAYPKVLPRRQPEPVAARVASPGPATAPAPVGAPAPGKLSAEPSAEADNQRDRSVEALINRLSGSIKRRDASRVSFKDAPHTLTAQERQANLSGRLAVPHLRALLEEAAAASEAGSKPDIAALAARYRIDERLLRLVLRYNKLPPRPK